MTQEKSSEQTHFFATALEREILSLIGGGMTAEKIIDGVSEERKKAMPNALEGLRAKRFVAQDSTGLFVLTEEGKRQI